MRNLVHVDSFRPLRTDEIRDSELKIQQIAEKNHMQIVDIEFSEQGNSDDRSLPNGTTSPNIYTRTYVLGARE